MYSKEETQQLQKQAICIYQTTLKILLSRKVKLKSLRNVLRFHEYRYYILNDPLISDFEYDQLFKALEKIETENPNLITSDSPTQRVAKGLTKDFPTVQHLVPMLSLDNSYNAEDLIDFDRKARELTGLNEIEYCVEPKFDGGSISLFMKMICWFAAPHEVMEWKEMKSPPISNRSEAFPSLQNFHAYGIQQIEIRGEVLINKKNFAKYNEQLVEQGLAAIGQSTKCCFRNIAYKRSERSKQKKSGSFCL